MSRAMYIYCHRRIQFLVGANVDDESVLGMEWDKMTQIDRANTIGLEQQMKQIEKQCLTLSSQAITT